MLEAVWAGFADPPDEARPRAWWHWMDGNVDADGIRLDLEWLHGVGVRGVQMFDGGMGTPLVVPERVEFGSAPWREALHLAKATARRLGLEFAVATSPGWSAAGGPWVSRGDAMKKFVWSEIVVTGGATVELALPPLPDAAGPFQDLPRWGSDPEANRFGRDWITIAVPDDSAQRALRPVTVTASSPIDRPERLTDGHYADVVVLPRDPDHPSSAWIELGFAAPVTVSAVTVGLPAPQGFGAAAFPPVTARRFRLVLSGEAADSALPRLAAGVRVPPVLRHVSEFGVSEFALYPGGACASGRAQGGLRGGPGLLRA